MRPSANQTTLYTANIADAKIPRLRSPLLYSLFNTLLPLSILELYRIQALLSLSSMLAFQYSSSSSILELYRIQALLSLVQWMQSIQTLFFHSYIHLSMNAKHSNPLFNTCSKFNAITTNYNLHNVSLDKIRTRELHNSIQCYNYQKQWIAMNQHMNQWVMQQSFPWSSDAKSCQITRIPTIN